MSGQQQAVGDGSDLRREARLNYRVGMWFAENLGDLPASEAFEPGETRNLSTSGISFFCEREIVTGTELILKLGNEANPIHLSATVIHCQPDSLGESRPYFVGCEFTGRLFEPTAE